ncbi:MAG: DUF885 family protein [Pseudomonadota bacterium]
MQLLHMIHVRHVRITRIWPQAYALKVFFAGAALACLTPLTACSQNEDGSRSTRRAIAQSQAIAEDFLRTELALSPEKASRLDMEEELGRLTAFALDNHSQAGFERRRLVRIELLQRLRQRPQLPDGHPLALDLLIAETALTDLIALEQFGYGRHSYASQRPYAIDPYSGVWIEGPYLLAYRQTINTPDDAAAYIARLRSLSEALQDTRRRLIADQAAGIYLPKNLGAETQRRMSRLIERDPSGLDLIATTFEALTLDVPDLGFEQRTQMVSLVRSEVEEVLRPAYLNLVLTLDDTSDAFSDQAGIWALPQGPRLYAAILRAAVGAEITTDRLHQRYTDEVAALNAAIRSSLILATEPDESDPAPVDPGPERLSSRIAWFIDAQQTSTASADLLSDAPATEILKQLAPQSPWQRVSASSQFEAQIDSNLRLADLLNLEPYADWQQASDLTPLRMIMDYSAIVDAWRMYAWKQQSPPEDVLAQVADQRVALIQMTLAAADTGLHLERWTLPEATDFIAVNTGLNEPLSRQLALSVMAKPGHHAATASALQTMEALSLRAKAVLGERYSETDFQRALIAPGPRPLPLIEFDIETWYGERLAN